MSKKDRTQGQSLLGGAMLLMIPGTVTDIIGLAIGAVVALLHIRLIRSNKPKAAA